MKFENHKYYNCEITLSDGSTYRVSANWIHNENLDQWQGWRCEAGVTRLYIDKDFNVHSAQCKNDQLGHVIDGFKLFDQPGVCRRQRCTGCTDDLILEKSKNE